MSGAAVAEQAISAAATPPAEPPRVVDNSFAEEDAELERVTALVKAEEAAKAGQVTPVDPASSVVATPAEPAQPAAATPATPEKSQTAAIIALRRRVQAERDARLVAEGKAAAYESIAHAPKEEPPETPVSTPEEQLAEIDKGIMALAEAYEAGKITPTEWKKQEMALIAQQRELQDQRHEAVARQAAEDAAARAAAPANDLALEEHSNQLLVDYPVLRSLSVEQLQPFARMVYDQAYLEGRGIPIGPVGTKILREGIARLAERKFDPERAALRDNVKPNDPAPPPGPTPAQREAKLRLASGMPPDIGTIGSGAPGGEISEAAAAAALNGNEDVAMRFMDANPAFFNKLLGGGIIRPAK